MIAVPRGLAVELNARQQASLAEYAEQLQSMNRRINLVSREDIDSVRTRHIPHCLTLAIRRFPAGAVVVDWGTGGGLPLIPLAIVFPEVQFRGVDAVNKKVQAVRAMARHLNLANVDAWHGRAQEYTRRLDYSVSRATAPLATLLEWHYRAAASDDENGEGEWQRGLICLKGGDLDDELADARRRHDGIRIEALSIDHLLDDPYFAGKQIISVSDESMHG